MPNWCTNSVVLKHDDPEFIERARSAIQEKGLFSEFIPTPKELVETTAGYLGDGYAQELNQFKMQLNEKYFGHKDWYDWNIANWGTKWDVTGESQDIEGGLMLNFDSAWAPPVAAYEQLKDMGFYIEAMYYEPGMAFVGSWTDGFDTPYAIEGNSEWVRENIPEYLDEAFAISENMEQWEEEYDE